MKYFIIEGILKNQDKMNDTIMKNHMSYTQKAMDNNLILLSGLKTDMSGGLFIMKANSIDDIYSYLSNEPFKINNIQDYNVTEFSPHYFNESLNTWFINKNS